MTRAINRIIAIIKQDGIFKAFWIILHKARRRICFTVKAVTVHINSILFMSDRYLVNRVNSDWNNLEEFLKHLKNRNFNAFPFSDMAENQFWNIFLKKYPKNQKQTREAAQQICKHKIKILGYEFNFKESINWHLNPDTNKCWPKQYTGKIENWMWSKEWPGDIKLPWELNRHQYFITLSKGYMISKDQKFSLECANQINHWIKKNPYMIGINWLSSLEIAIRLISWCFTFLILRNSEFFAPLAGKNLLKSIYQQTNYLSNNLTSDWEVPNNHIIGEVTALILVGALFPEFKESEEWVKTGLEILNDEMKKQTFEDGMNKEQSPAYHNFVLDFLILVIILSRQKLIPAVPILESYSEKMIEYCMYATSPDGKIPMIGDCDDGRGYKFDAEDNYLSFRDKLAIGAVVFNRPEFKYIAKNFGEEAYFLLGPDGMKSFEELKARPPIKNSMCFPQGGQYIIRDNWLRSSDYCIFRCGDFGLGGEGFCAHAHCDLLSFMLMIEGKPGIVDSGTFTYHGPLRDYFRLTSAHNTVKVDGIEQAYPKNEFAWSAVPKASCEYWDGNRVSGLLNGKGDVRIKRDIDHPKPGIWIIQDSLSGSGQHIVEWFFHFAPCLSLKIENERFIKIREKDWQIRIKPPDMDMLISKKDGWYSPSYGVKQQNQILNIRWRGELTNNKLFIWEFRKD